MQLERFSPRSELPLRPSKHTNGTERPCATLRLLHSRFGAVPSATRTLPLIRTSTALGGANFVLHAAGWLEGGLCTGYEKLVIDADRLGAYQVMLGGLPLDDNALARDAYGEVEPAGHFLGCSHTMANYETAYYDAVLSNSESFEQWEDDGAKDTERRAFERWNFLLASYQAPAMDEAKDEELRDFVARKKASMADAWY